MSDQENQWKRSLQQAQNTARQNNDPPPEEKEPEEQEPGKYLPMMPEPLERNLSDDIIASDPKSPRAEGEKMTQKLTSKIREFTSNCLFAAWQYPSCCLWGWLYIPLHFILSFMGGPLANYFPKAGREVPKRFLSRLPLPKKFKKWTEEIIGQLIEPFEYMTACCFYSCAIAPILCILFIGWLIANPCKTLEVLSSTLLSIAKTLGICP